MSLINELKRRNVFKLSAAYLAFGWVVTQVTATVTPAFHLPESALSLVTWIGVIGFPLVVIFAWIYELTPEGLKRESEVDRSQSITHVTSHRLDHIIIGLLVLAIGLFAFDRFNPRERSPAQAAVAEPHSLESATPQTTPVKTTRVVVAPDVRSIAVLPFVNMSEDANNEFFSDGISEELLNLLAKIPQLHVAARTSSFAFKGEKVDIATVAEKLHVAHVLEGSVRKSGNHVRITAQLIRAEDGYHLWSENYDRTLDDIFVVQDEIAGAVVVQLKITLLGAAPVAREVDSKAYALFLQARQLGRQGTPDGLEQSIALYMQVLAIDPGYVAARVELARNYVNQAGFGLRPADEGFRLAREEANKAIAIDADFAFAHGVLGWIAMSHDGDLAAAARHYEHALALEPANPDIIGGAAVLASRLRRPDQAVALDKYAIASDPMNPTRHANLGFNYRSAGRLDEAIASWHTALLLSPGYDDGLHETIGVALLLKGEPEAALAEMQRGTSERPRRSGLPMAFHALGRKAESDAALAELIQKHGKDDALSIAVVLAYRNEVDGAFAWLEKAMVRHETGLSEFAVSPLFANIAQDPRWLSLLRKIGEAPEQLAAIKFDVNLPK